jgi:hypothetical protein
MTLVQQLGQWFRSVTTHALGKWTLMQEEPCAHPRCRERAVYTCVACQEPSCLQHAYLGQDASFICQQCVEATIEDFEDLDDEESSAPNDSFAQAEAEDRAESLRVLNLDKKATWEDVQERFRELSLKHHPDRQAGKTDKQRQRSEAKFKRVTEAYHKLERIMRRAA